MVVGLVLIIDMICAFRYYYLTKAYNYSIRKLDIARLSYLRRTVISGFRLLASEDVIYSGIKEVRELEAELNEDPVDFTEHELKYKKDLNDVLKRGYF